MPRGDRTGPMGMGPMTGRGAGFCTGNAVPGFMNTTTGRGGMGRGRCFGRGMGRGYGWAVQNAPVTFQQSRYSQTDELSALKDQAKYLGEAIKSINSRISELDHKLGDR